MRKPQYLNSWKGQVLKAIIIDNAKTWIDIKYHSRLSESQLNQALAELFDVLIIHKTRNNTYKVTDPEIISDYKRYFGKGIIQSIIDKLQKPVPRVKDDKHAQLVQKILTLNPFQANYYNRAEFVFNFKGYRGSIDVLKWLVDSHGTAFINIYEIKPELIDIGETIRQINNYKNYLSTIKDTRLGPHSAKIINTFLVVSFTDRNLEIIDRFKEMLYYSGLTGIIFNDERNHKFYTKSVQNIYTQQFWTFV